MAKKISKSSKEKNIGILFTEISWDTDGEDPEEYDLPVSHKTYVAKDFDPDEDGAELLSTEFGFLVKGFSYQIL